MFDVIIATCGQVVVWIMMAFSAIGTYYSVKNDKEGLGREWMRGLEANWTYCVVSMWIYDGIAIHRDGSRICLHKILRVIWS